MTNIELTRYNNFLLKQTELNRKREIRLIYRGESIQNLCKKLNIYYDCNDENIDLISEMLFVIGEKSKRYLTDDEDFTIDNCEDYVFDNIMKYFSSKLKCKNSFTKDFFKRNVEIENFFSQKSNRLIFLEKMKDATFAEKNSIRNYYLTVLHQLSAVDYKNKSHFISTSTDYNEAVKFSKEVIFHCWQPVKSEKNIIRKYNLPIYTVEPYAYQKEITLLGGIFPHFISAIEFTKTNIFVPNPNIFRTNIKTEHFINGLEIDQSNFDEVLKTTNYKRKIISNGECIWEE